MKDENFFVQPHLLTQKIFSQKRFVTINACIKL